MNAFLMTKQSACNHILKSVDNLGSCSVLNAAGNEALFKARRPTNAIVLHIIIAIIYTVNARAGMVI